MIMWTKSPKASPLPPAPAPEATPLPAAPAPEASIAASRALQIVDIVQEILESLSPRILTLSDYRTFISTRNNFLRTALTCHTFLEPSLDILWRSMHSIAPLLKLLSSRGFQERDGEYILSGLTLESTSKNWHRINYYGRRIKYFYHDPTSPTSLPLPSHTCNAILHYFPSSLLPNLDALHIDSLHPAYDAVLFMMTSSSLRHLEISNIQAQNRNLVDSLLICLREKSHNIHHLTLGGTFPSEVPQLVEYLTGLRSLDLTSTVLEERVFQPTLRKIADLPLLKAVKLNLGGGTGSQLPPTTWSASIDHLTLKGSVSKIAAFLNNHEMPHIRDISLEFPFTDAGNTHPAEDWSTFEQILSLMVLRWSDLQAVVLDIERFTHPSVSTYITPLAFRKILGSLADLSKLNSLRLDPETPSVTWKSLSSTDYWELANSFPALEHLALPRGNVITMDALSKVAQLCPQLHSLAVGVDTQTFPTLPATQYSAITHGLRVLSVGDSSLQNIHLVTRHLNRLFPHLEAIVNTNPAWVAVWDLLTLQRSMAMDNSQRTAPMPLDDLKAEPALDSLSGILGRAGSKTSSKKRTTKKR
ncbi:hypothetical protein BDN72DRAFT_956736 [Pluteus cervinus]|uniref:Uncharacterized protein n=1 Tax=Pluteus cervinus TaxID=181527 RepID=A0ACD3B806_9AGAR|nr:hypothetical protein BDN72DRAFT_956736 [Pluteus cervinus]